MRDERDNPPFFDGDRVKGHLGRGTVLSCWPVYRGMVFDRWRVLVRLDTSVNAISRDAKDFTKEYQ